MKDLFPGFYPPTEAQYDSVWKTGLVVIDTNVLLDLYRLPANARDELLQVMADLNERLWIPHQVALEFQRSRLTVIADVRKITQEALDSANTSISELTKQVEGLQLDKHGLGLEPDTLLSELRGAFDKLTTALQAVHDARLDPGQEDPIRRQIDQILKDRVGPAPENQAALDALVSNGTIRYEERIPPGFLDAEKARDPKTAHYFHNGLKYQSKFGDLIVWRQLIAHLNALDTKEVILVTRDNKEDWWRIEKGKRTGPQPELVTEIKREANVDLFWMYRPDQFLAMAKTYGNAKVSPSSLDELKALLPRERSGSKENLRLFDVFQRRTKILSENHVQDIVLAFLEQKFQKIEINASGFPDAFIFHSGSKIAVEVLLLGDIGSSAFAEKAKSSIVIGHDLASQHVADDFMLVCVISADAASKLDHEYDELTVLQYFLEDTMNQFPVREVIIGTIKNEVFRPLAEILNEK
ncbi:PIN domain-containing protein [Rhizobium sp. L245/93]|uniref:PIN-like domain-containing protein n=1 Tax=Rhizobium sp. L245/93 TaxID=2819998 RepID=UPI001ADA107E|nr:DUF4935 domain-containing protein [Rhizobium sp. L245/93]